MPLGRNIRYRVTQTSKGPVRLAWKGGQVIEAKNLSHPERVHTPEEFKADRVKAKKGK